MFVDESSDNLLANLRKFSVEAGLVASCHLCQLSSCLVLQTNMVQKISSEISLV